MPDTSTTTTTFPRTPHANISQMALAASCQPPYFEAIPGSNVPASAIEALAQQSESRLARKLAAKPMNCADPTKRPRLEDCLGEPKPEPRRPKSRN